TIWVLGIEKIVDSFSHRTAKLLVAQEAIPADEHQPAKSRNPHRTLPVRRKRAPAPIYPLAIDQREIIGQEVRSRTRMEKHAQRMRDQLQVLRASREAPAGLFLQEKSVVIFDELVDVI